MKKQLFLCAMLLLACACSRADDFNYGKAAAKVIETLPQTHLLQKTPSPELAAQAWTNYLSSLDVERIYFRQDDLDAFESHRLIFVQGLQKGDDSFAVEVFNVYKTRVAERVAYVETLLETPFDFTVEESYRWKRRNEPWPADLAAQDELWRKRIKNEMLNRIVNRELRGNEAVSSNQYSVISIQYPVISNLWSVSSEQLAVISNQYPVISNLWSVSSEPSAVSSEPSDEMQDEEPKEELKEETDAEFILKKYQAFKTIIDDNDREFFLSRWINAWSAVYDPHTDWMSPASQEDFSINMNISLTGIGAQLRPKDGAAEIAELIPGGPAERDTRDIRLVPGDRIIAVAQGDAPSVSIMHWPLYKAVRLIRGAKGSKVVLTVIPANDPSGSTTKTVDLIRDEVKLEEQAASSSIETVTDGDGNERKLGIVRLPTFYSSMDGSKKRSCSGDVRAALMDFRSNNVEGVILDLRSNGGGALKEAVDLAGLFIRTGNIVLVKERTQVHALADYNPEIACTKPLVIMIDRLSASASEIVAAALRDYGRAVLVGDSRTHGKGTVQQLLPLGRSSAQGTLKVTNASFFRINGSSTQAKGVESDVFLPSPFEFFPDIGEDRLPNAIPWSQVPARGFIPLSDLEPFIPELQKRSALRLADNERWQKYYRRIKHMETVNAMEELPLEIDQRRAFAAVEKEVDDLQNEIDGESDDETSVVDKDQPLTREEKRAARRAKDVVLDEALLVLVDLIDTQGPIPALQESSPKSMSNIFDTFFR